MKNQWRLSQSHRVSRCGATIAGAFLTVAILGGCGQKGPLTLPTPQFPAPPAAKDDRPKTAPNPESAPVPKK